MGRVVDQQHKWVVGDSRRQDLALLTVFPNDEVVCLEVDEGLVTGVRDRREQNATNERLLSNRDAQCDRTQNERQTGASRRAGDRRDLARYCWVVRLRGAAKSLAASARVWLA